jgi:hypothetical protein
MAAFQRFGNPPLYVDDFAEIFLSMKEKLGVGKKSAQHYRLILERLYQGKRFKNYNFGKEY